MRLQTGDQTPAPTKPKAFYKALYFQVVVGLALGILAGHLWPDFGASLKPLGDGFVKLVKMMIAPVVFCTIVSGITSLNDTREIGKTLVKSMVLFYILTALALLTGLAAVLTRMVRTAMLEELGQDYIRTARAKGLPERDVVYRHALRNALIPVLTVIGLQFGSLFSGAIVTETIFSWPGIGRLTLSAISNRDYALVQGCILAVGLTYVGVNLLTDVGYTLANPRIRA